MPLPAIYTVLQRFHTNVLIFRGSQLNIVHCVHYQGFIKLVYDTLQPLTDQKSDFLLDRTMLSLFFYRTIFEFSSVTIDS